MTDNMETKSKSVPLRRISGGQLNVLTNEFNILHLIYFRSKNQHRQSIWWKYLDILHRYTRKIIKLGIDIERTKVSKVDKISYKQSQIDHMVSYLVKKIFKRAYFEFNNIIALGQFISLGFTLVGLLSKLYAIFIDIAAFSETSSSKQLRTVMETTVAKANVSHVSHGGEDDLGEEVVFESSADSERKRKLEEEVPEEARQEEVSSISTVKRARQVESITTTTKVKSKKKKANYDSKPPLSSSSTKRKKSSKRTIDDIFGF